MPKPSPEDAKTTGPKLWVVLARAYGALAAYVESRIAAEGLCLSDFMVLEVLLHKGPMTISSIGEKVLLAVSSMTAAVDRLEKRAFVVRQSSPGDRRARLVALTPAGQTFISDLYTRHAGDIEAVMSGLDSKERNRLRESLKKLGLAADAAAKKAASHPAREILSLPDTHKPTTRMKGKDREEESLQKSGRSERRSRSGPDQSARTTGRG